MYLGLANEAATIGWFDGVFRADSPWCKVVLFAVSIRRARRVLDILTMLCVGNVGEAPGYHIMAGARWVVRIEDRDSHVPAGFGSECNYVQEIKVGIRLADQDHRQQPV
jgi:hypothetical protein